MRLSKRWWSRRELSCRTRFHYLGKNDCCHKRLYIHLNGQGERQVVAIQSAFLSGMLVEMEMFPTVPTKESKPLEEETPLFSP